MSKWVRSDSIREVLTSSNTLRNVKIFIKAKPNAKESKVTPPALKLLPDAEELWTVSVKEKPSEGKANEAIIKILAKHFEVPRSHIRLIQGATSRKKIFEITPYQ